MEIGLNLYPQKMFLGTLSDAMLDASNLRFAKQLGISKIVAWMPFQGKNGYWDYEEIMDLKDFVQAHGLQIEAFENLPPLHYDRILLGLDGMEKQIENIAKTLRNLGRAKIRYLGFCFSILGYWGHWRIGEDGGGRGGAGITSFDYEKIKDSLPLEKGIFWDYWKAPYYDAKSVLDIQRKDLWDRFIYLLFKILPIAEEAGVGLAIHPDDPPAPVLRNIPKIMHNPYDFKRMIRIFKQNSLGLEFCQGTFAEMEGVGADVIDLIRYFGKKDKIFYIHFRNVKGSFPKYEEVFIDEGDIDCLDALKAYRDAGFQGLIIPDHVPMVNATRQPWHSGIAHSVGYIQGLLDAIL